MTDEIKKKIEDMYACVGETYRGGMVQAAEFGYQLAQEEQPNQDELWNELREFIDYNGKFFDYSSAKKRYRITRI